MTEPTKFCKDCRFRKRQFLDLMRNARCLHPRSHCVNDTRYLVDANGREREWCTTMRVRPNLCGPDAKFWEPR
jgi:hypothetical protein